MRAGLYSATVDLARCSSITTVQSRISLPGAFAVRSESEHAIGSMSSKPSRPASPSTSTSARIVDLLFGLLLAAIAVAILIWSEPSTLAGSLVAALILGGLGIESIYSAKRRRRSLVARIGPLP